MSCKNVVLTKVGMCFGKEAWRFFPLCALVCFLIVGCASSNVSREAASNFDMGLNNAQSMADGVSSGNLADSYQNVSQAGKGAIVGGTTGAVTGVLSSGIGVIPGTLTGALLGASYGSYIDSNTTLKDRLDNRGANIVVLGDQILIVIPSARIFEPMTANIKPQAYSTLEMVAQYINQFTKMMVKIGVYSAAYGSPRTNLALTTQQAQHVARFLLASGVDARVLYAAGYGGTHLVSKNTLGWSESDNYRIEITLEKLYV